MVRNTPSEAIRRMFWTCELGALACCCGNRADNNNRAGRLLLESDATGGGGCSRVASCSKAMFAGELLDFLWIWLAADKREPISEKRKRCRAKMIAARWQEMGAIYMVPSGKKRRIQGLNPP